VRRVPLRGRCAFMAGAGNAPNGLTGAKMSPQPADALPTDTYYGGSKTVEVGGRKAQLNHVYNAHTDGDTWIYFDDANVLDTGDTFTNTAAMTPSTLPMAATSEAWSVRLTPISRWRTTRPACANSAPGVRALAHGTASHGATLSPVHSHRIAIVLASVLAFLVVVMLILGVRSGDRPPRWPASTSRSSR
jgi:hypothetical protein